MRTLQKPANPRRRARLPPRLGVIRRRGAPSTSPARPISPRAGSFWNRVALARTLVPILFVSGQHLSLEHLFDRPPPEDLAAGQMQLHMLVRGQIHRE